MKATKFTLVGTRPLIHHSNQVLADPLHKTTQRIKLLQKGRAKTDEDIEEALRLEFMAGLYVSSEGYAVLPADNLNRMLADAAAKVSGITRRQSESFLYAETARLLHEAPEARNGDLATSLWESSEPCFRLIRPAKMQSGSTVIRSRCQFSRWAAVVTVSYDPKNVKEEKVGEVLVAGGEQIGVCDWRPKHGRFRVLELETDKEVRKALKKALDAVCEV